MNYIGLGTGESAALYLRFGMGISTAIVVPSAARGAGAAGKRLRRLVVEIDGKEYAVQTQQEAIAVLRQARESVKREIRAEVRQVQVAAAVPDLPEVPQIQVHGDDDMVAAMQPQVERFRRDMYSIFVQANLRLQEVLAEQDDEDVLMLL